MCIYHATFVYSAYFMPFYIVQVCYLAYLEARGMCTMLWDCLFLRTKFTFTVFSYNFIKALSRNYSCAAYLLFLFRII